MRRQRVDRITAGLDVLALSLSLLLAVAPSVAAQGSTPDWSIGDYWEYRGQMDIMGQPYAVNLKHYVTGNAIVAVGGNAYDAFQSRVWENASFMGTPIEMTGNTYVRTSDIANVRGEMQSMGSQYNITYDPPLEQFRFPLSDGQTWSQTTTANMTIDGSPSSTTTTLDFSVAGPEVVTVPAGTFSAYNITMQERGTSNWTGYLYSDVVGFNVRQILVMAGFGAMLLDLQSYRHVPNKAPAAPTVSAIPNPADIGELVTFTASATDPDGDPLTYSWEFGDAGTGTGSVVTHAYSSSGSFTANVIATDGKGGLSRASVMIVVNQPNLPPNPVTMDADPNPADVGQLVTFTASATDPDGDPVSFSWLFGDGGTDNGLMVTHVYLAAGFYTVNVTASDGRGGFSWAEMTVIVNQPNRPPGPITVNANPFPADVGQVVTFTAAASDPDGDPISCSWRFGDGGTDTGPTVTHAYSTAGSYTVNVTASDGRGGFSWAEMTMIVNLPNRPPGTPAITASPNPALTGEVVTFTVSATDPDGDSLTFSWEFGDGATGGGSPATHSYSAAGTYQANATASDGKGGDSRASVTVTVTQANRRPGLIALSATPNPANVGQAITFTAAAIDPDGDTLMYSWTFGDTATATGGTVTHPYSSAGTFTVNVTASDGNGGESWAETTITVVQPNRAPGMPTLSASPNPAKVGDVVALTATATDPDGDTVTYSWKFGDGETGTGASVSHAYQTAGTFTVNVRASDGRGGESWAEVMITVKEKDKAEQFPTWLVIAFILILAVAIAAVVVLLLRRKRKSASEVPDTGGEKK